ncbi:hypothetical protein J7J90_01590 [Candidatus Micrarchaeota archaeon]|nr:hypothetical protein [Candidatus Micrarchaeota archaeon]
MADVNIDLVKEIKKLHKKINRVEKEVIELKHLIIEEELSEDELKELENIKKNSEFISFSDFKRRLHVSSKD